MTTNTDTRTIYTLARMAGCADPASATSPGAEFLRSVETSTEEAIEYGRHRDDDLYDVAHEIADGCVPVYTYTMWQTFTDLAAWQVDLDDLGMPDDMTTGAMWALYEIGRELAAALLQDAIDNDETEREN